MSIEKMEVGKRVSALRKRNGMTQENLAELLDCSVKHISHVERGMALPSLEKCVFISEHFHCSLDYLIKGQGKDDVSNILPSYILEVLRSDNIKEQELLLTYLNMFAKMRKL